MSELKDLTRWNRAALTRFRYVNGNAIEYLEILRQKLVKNFPQSTGQGNWLNPAEEVPANEEESETESLIERQERLSRKQKRILEMYRQDRRDWAWEISRTLSRACHILTEHTNAYANEGYLGTATQWDHVRRLVEMLDYHPAPPASASTRLVFIAKENKTDNGSKKEKENKTGIVAKGFQVKYSPPNGGAKVVFETLEDLVVDPALNELRPKGWNKSDASALATEPSGEAQTSGEADGFSELAKKPVIHLQGAGTVWAGILDDNGYSMIKDLLNLDPTAPELSQINERVLRELKAKAIVVSNFELEAGWLELSEMLLPDIASASPSSLAELTGKRAESVEDLQKRIELVGACLDHEVYKTAMLTDLVASLAAIEGAVATAWYEKKPPKVSPGQVAMVYHQSEDKAEAATVAVVDKTSGQITLLPGPEFNWWEWPRSEAVLNVAPRWKRGCWLNGRYVVRTKAPHGLSAESYVSWKIDSTYISWKVNKEWGGYELRLRKIKDLDELVATGSSLLIIALVEPPESLEDPKLHFRIFDNNEVKADITESALLNREAVTYLKQRLTPLPDYPAVSQEERRELLEHAMACFLKWRYAKVIEVDKRDLRLELTGPPHIVLPHIGADLYELRPIDGPVFPTEYDAVVLLGESDAPSPVESIPPELPESEEDALFCLREVLPAGLKKEDGTPADPGGGLLPPASLPEIGCFLFPSPMLPLDLVKAAVELMLSIGVMAIPSTGEIVIKGMPFGGLLEAADGGPADAASRLFDMLNALEGIVQKHNEFCKPLWFANNGGETTENPTGTLDPVPVGTTQNPEKLVVWRDELSPGVPDETAIKEALTEMLTLPEGKEATALFKKLTEDITERGPLLTIPKTPMVKAVVQASDPLYMFNGRSEIGAGDWVVGQFVDELKAVKVSTVNWFTDEDRTETFSLGFESLEGHPELQKVYADFRGEIIAEGAKFNATQVEDKIELEEVPENLKIGHEVLLTAENKDPVVARIEDIEGNKIITDPSAKGFTKGELIILGNVVLAGHGESKPTKILGSGDAAKSSQEFTLEVEQVSFTPDATKSSGVAAAIEVEVDGRIWEQVSTLKDSSLGDHHYAIRMTEEGYVKILFGDGEYGRRLPSGKNNIRVRYRVGSGLAGNNVPAGSLEKPVNPHPLIEAVHQPFPTTGGGDMEDVVSLRENAPPTLLALERAVSLSDFSHLAVSLSYVWQAKAYSEILHGGRTESVKVVIVPPDGVESEDIKNAVRLYLQKHALPGVHVSVEHFTPVRFDLSVTVRVITDEFVAEEVEKAVASALLDHFTLKNRKLGEHLYLSEVYKVVEGIKGVENSICEIFEQTPEEEDSSEQDEPIKRKALQIIKAGNESTVIFLDTEADKKPSTLIVTHEEYEP